MKAWIYPENYSEKVYNGPDYVIVYDNSSKRLYQIFCLNYELRAYYVGKVSDGPNEIYLQHDKENLRSPGKNDIALPLENINFQIIKLDNQKGKLGVNLSTRRSKYRFCQTDNDADSFRLFWSENILKAQQKVRLHGGEGKYWNYDEYSLALAKKVTIIYMIYLAIVAVAWLFLPVPYILFSVLNIIALPVLIVLCILFEDELTLAETRYFSVRHSVGVPALVSSLIILLRSLLDFNILNWARVFVLAVVFFVISLAACLMISQEWRRKASAIICIVWMLLNYSIGTTIQLNHVLGFNGCTMETATIENMYISHGTKSPDLYHIELVMSDSSSLDLKVSKRQYKEFEIDDSVSVEVYDGFFGIDYARIE